MRLGALEKQVLEEGRLWMAEELENKLEQGTEAKSQQELRSHHTSGGSLNAILPASPF